MEFDPITILIGLAGSGVGYVYFSYGRKQAKAPLIICGITLMVYPYLVSGVVPLVAVGIVLTALPFLFRWW